MAETAAKRIRPDGKQGKPDGRHDSRRNDGRYKFPPPCRAKAEDPLQNSSDKDSAENSAVAVFQSDHTKNGNKSKADSHDDRKSAAQTEDGIHLEQGADACNDHGRLDNSARF